MLTDLSQTLREEERIAWQRLLRVLGQGELNNSLAPIKSWPAAWQTCCEESAHPADLDDDMQRGLKRSLRAPIRWPASSSRTQEARAAASASLRAAEHRRAGAAGGQSRDALAGEDVVSGPELLVKGDEVQLEQLLINLVRNAVDASMETHGDVGVGWEQSNGQVEVWISDEGPGSLIRRICSCPFFTTKAKGSGIGLVLSRQIAEAHGRHVDT